MVPSSGDSQSALACSVHVPPSVFVESCRSRRGADAGDGGAESKISSLQCFPRFRHFPFPGCFEAVSVKGYLLTGTLMRRCLDAAAF